MDKALAGERAADALRATLDADPRHIDAFVRLRLLLDEQGEHERLAELLEQRLMVEDNRVEQLMLHRAIAELSRNFLENREAAKRHYRAIVDAVPTDVRAIGALSDIAWEQGAWAECAEVLTQRARLEREPHVLRGIYFRLGVIHSDRLPDAETALAAFQKVLSYDPNDEHALERIADLGIATQQWKMALGACERLVKNEQDPQRKVAHLHRVGVIFANGFGDRRRAERAYQLAVDAAPDNDAALAALIKFYEDAGDVASIRVHLGLVAASMRSRLGMGHDPTVLKVIARVARARHDAGVPGQGAVARSAADLARMYGVDPGDPPALPPPNLAGLTRPEIDEVLWPRSISPEIRQIFGLLGERLSKHVGIDLRPYGVTRGDRVRPQQSPVAAAAQEVADGLGLGEIDVYISQRQPFAMVAEPTQPISLVLGSEVASPDRLSAVRFAAGGALVLARAQLAIAARMPIDELGVLVIALLRLFHPDLPYLAVDNDQVSSQLQRLKRLVPSGLMSELRPYALGIHTASFDHRVFARDLELAAHRAGLIAAGGAGAPLRVLLARHGATDLAQGMAHHAISELVRFAISEDHAAMAAMCR
jgi:tetratricopeptide (TPR) repeat protein